MYIYIYIYMYIYVYIYIYIERERDRERERDVFFCSRNPKASPPWRMASVSAVLGLHKE